MNTDNSTSVDTIVQNNGKLEALIARLNGSMGCEDVVCAIIQACKTDSTIVSARLAVSHDKCTGDMKFATSREELPVPDTRRSNSLVIVHECGILHVPMIIGTDMSVDTVCDLCQFLVEKGCDVNSVASQEISIRENGNTFDTVCEHSGKTPIFYAIERRWARVVQMLIALGADYRDVGMYSAYSYSERTTPLVYAMEEVSKTYRRGDSSFAVIDILLGKVGIDPLIEEMKGSRYIMNTALLFVALVGVDLELYPGTCIEAVKGEYMHIVEFFLKCSRLFKDEIVDVKRTTKYRRVRESAIENKRALSEISSSYTFLSGSSACRKIRSVSGLNWSNAANNGMTFSIHLEDTEMSILALAAYHGKESVIKWMLEQEITDVNRCNGYGFNAMHHAAAENHVTVVKLLMDAGASTTSRYMPYMTVAHTAALNGAIDVIKFLHLRCPELLLQVDCDGRNVLHYAADSQKKSAVDVAKYIISFVKGIDLNGTIDSDSGYKLLLSRIEVESQKNQSITESAKEDILISVKERNSFADNSVTPLHIAVESGNIHVAKVFIENKCCDLSKKNQQGFTALNMNTKVGTILHMAVRRRDQEFTKKLLSLDVDVNAKCSRGYTALDYAIRNRDKAIINLLLADSRQDIISGVGKAKVSYAKILKYRNLLDDKGRTILLRRNSWREKKLNGFLVVAACVSLLAMTVIAVVARAGTILSFMTGREVNVSLETRVIAVVAVMALMTLVYVVFGAVYMLEESKRLGNERAYFSEFYSGGESNRRARRHVKPSSSRCSSCYSSSGNKSALCTDPCSGNTSSDNLVMNSAFISRMTRENHHTAVSDINYLADDSECEYIVGAGAGYKHRRLYEASSNDGRRRIPKHTTEANVERCAQALCRQ